MTDEPMDDEMMDDDMMDDDMMEESMEYLEDSDPTLGLIETTLDTFLASANVDAVYGEPVEVGDHLVIPSAEVLSVLGFGVGSGFGTSPSTETGAPSEGGGGGGGGGGRVFSRPVAVIVSSPDGVRVEPVVDLTKIALAALTAAGFMFTMILRMLRGPQDDD